MMVSLFPHIKATTGAANVELESVLDAIRAGRWAREVAAVRRATTAPERRQLKAALPYFTASGTFAERKDAGLLQHSGIVALDLDGKQNPNWDMGHAKAALARDPYTYAVFVSAGGEGLCVLVRIPGDDHVGSFRSLAIYFAAQHGLFVDSLPDVSRPRYVSDDADLFLNPDAERWEDVEAAPAPKASAPVLRSAYRPSTHGEGYGQDALARCLAKVYGAPDGQKHVMLNKMAYLCGGLIAGGFLSEGECRSALRQAIGQREIADEKGAFKTIDDGLAAGQLKPVLPEALQFSARTALRNHTAPAAVAASIAGSQGIPVDVVQAAVDLIAAEQGRGDVELLTFWDLLESQKRDGPKKLQLNLTRFGSWLGSDGFRQRAIGEKTRVVRLDGQVVRPVTRAQLKGYVLAYVESLPFEFDGVFRPQLEELVRRQHVSLFEEGAWEFLPVLPDGFLRDTYRMAHLCYRNGWAQVSAAGVELRPYDELPGLVWESQLIDRNFTPLRLEETELAEFFVFLWNLAGHREDRLMALFLFIGYYLHGYKDPSTPKIGVLVDEIAGTEGQSNGGTGKSLMFKAIGHLVEVLEVDGKGYDPRNTKALQLVTDATRAIFFNDWDTHRVPFDRLFNMATDTLTVERLYLGQQSYPFAVSPKIGITTNGMLTGQGGSHDRRKYELEVAPHYGPGHQPRDEFGHNFFDGWDADEWSRFDNLMLHCCHLYLQAGKLVAPASENLEHRRLLSATSAGFVDFMDAQPRGVELYRTQLLTDFRAAEGYDEKTFTPERFGRWLGYYKDLHTDFQSGQDWGGDNRGKRWIMLAKDPKSAALNT